MNTKTKALVALPPTGVGIATGVKHRGGYTTYRYQIAGLVTNWPGLQPLLNAVANKFAAWHPGNHFAPEGTIVDSNNDYVYELWVTCTQPLSNKELETIKAYAEGFVAGRKSTGG